MHGFIVADCAAEGGEDSVTFHDPAISRLQAQLASESRLADSHRLSSPQTLASKIRGLQYQEKSPFFGWTLFLVAGGGLATLCAFLRRKRLQKWPSMENSECHRHSSPIGSSPPLRT